VSFTNNSVGASSYQWQINGGPYITETSPTHVFPVLGVFDVNLKAISAIGCASIATGEVHVIVPFTDLSMDELVFSTDTQGQTRGIFTITNNSNHPVSSFDLVMETGSGVLITETVNEALEPFSASTIATKNSLTFLQGSAGYVCVTISTPGDEDINNDRQCVTTLGESVTFAPYPNPAQGSVMIQFVSTGDDELNVRLINETGADAYSVRVPLHQGLNLLNLDVSNLSPGLYVVKLTSSSVVTTQRVVIK
jgi:hypothetical protein